MSNSKTQNLSSWQRFKIWASRSFGCTSSYTVKDNDSPRPVADETKRTTEKNESNAEKPKVEVKPNFNGKANTNKDLTHSEVTRSFSKDAEDIEFIDASVVNIPQAVK